MFNRQQFQLQAQIQMSAYEKKVAYEKFQSTLKWLEKYVEIVHGDHFENWENRKQFRSDGIKRKDIANDPKRVEKLLSISFLSFEGFTDHPELLEKMKEEFHQWINATGINVDNCPENLRNYLVGLSEILEGRGGKINEDAINRKPMFDENSPEYAEGLNEFFRALQTPMNHAREEERVLKNKRYDELEVGGRLNDFDAEQGKKALKRIKFSNSDHNFYFFPQKKQRWGNLIDDDEEMILYSNKSIENANRDRKRKLGYNPSAVIKSVKDFKEDWRIDEIITNSDSSEKEIVLIRKGARLNDYGLWTRELNFKGNHIYRKKDFSGDEWKEIKEYLKTPNHSKIIEDIRRNINEWDFREEITSLASDYDKVRKWMRIKKGIETKELLLIHKSIGFEDLRYYHHGGDLVIDPKRIFRKQNFDEREWFETEKIWIDYQYDLAQRKLRGGVSLESWETWEGLRKWIFELENRGRKYQVPYYLVSDGVLADGKFCGEIALDSAEITQKQADFINQIQQELIRRKNKKEKTWIKGGKNNERLVLVTSEFVKVFSPCINI